MSSRIAEILLALALFLIIGFVRVYYGDDRGLMFVWKEGFSYKDTLVNLKEFDRLGRNEIEKDHLAVFDQLTEMGVIDPSQRYFLRPKHKVAVKYDAPNALPGQDNIAPDQKAGPAKSAGEPNGEHAAEKHPVNH